MLLYVIPIERNDDNCGGLGHFAADRFAPQTSILALYRNLCFVPIRTSLKNDKSGKLGYTVVT